jgi:hypothetical protein
LQPLCHFAQHFYEKREGSCAGSASGSVLGTYDLDPVEAQTEKHILEAVRKCRKRFFLTPCLCEIVGRIDPDSVKVGRGVEGVVDPLPLILVHQQCDVLLVVPKQSKSIPALSRPDPG